MLTFSKRMILITRYREWVERNRAELGRPVSYCPENFLAFLDTNGLIDADVALNFILQKDKEVNNGNT